MSVKEEHALEVSDTVMRLKRAFEDKNIESFRSQFKSNAKINADGRFMTLERLLESLKAFFEAVEQTYLDAVGTRGVEAEGEGFIATFDIDVAWVSKSDWCEHTQKATLTLEVERDPKARHPLISGLTATTHVPGRPSRPDEETFPEDVGFDDNRQKGAAVATRGEFDPFSFWY